MCNDNKNLYNENQKMRYLEASQYEESTRITILSVFRSTKYYEETVFGKDIANFTLSEVTDMLKGFNSKSRGRLEYNCSYLSNYFKWCFDEGLTSDMNDPFDNRIIVPIIKNILPDDLINMKYFNENTMQEYLDVVPDPTNKLLLYGLYCGIRGKNFIELRALKIEDYDVENKKLHLLTGRAIDVDETLDTLLFQANSSTCYYKDGIQKESRFNRFDYSESEFIFKICGTDDCSMVGDHLITRRLITIKKQIGNRYINSNTIYKNGLMKYIKNKYKEDGISLKTAFEAKNGKNHIYEERTQSYIEDFGSTHVTRMLRNEIKDFIDIF